MIFEISATRPENNTKGGTLSSGLHRIQKPGDSKHEPVQVEFAEKSPSQPSK